MRLAIISDIHANLEALCATLHDISSQRVSRIVCLGDIVGYNTNPAECVALLREHDAICVAGNHDRAVAGQITTQGFSANAARAVAWTRERVGADVLRYLAALPLQAAVGGDLVAVHGALLPSGGCDMTRLDSDDRRRQSLQALAEHPSGSRVCAFGHTHHPGIFACREDLLWTHTGDAAPLDADAYYLVNPGTVGRPRSADRRATYAILDTARRVVTIRGVEYDESVPLAKTRRAGLVAPGSFRLRMPTPVRAAVKWGARRLGVYDFLRQIRGSG